MVATAIWRKKVVKGALKGILSTLNELAQSLDWVANVTCAKYYSFTRSGKLTLLLQSLSLFSHPSLRVFGRRHLHMSTSLECTRSFRVARAAASPIVPPGRLSPYFRAENKTGIAAALLSSTTEQPAVPIRTPSADNF